MGNIISVSRDGKQKKAYTYDALNRIISEKDIDKEQEICYTYDNNGNILTKSVNGVVTSYAYEEGTDRLTSYGAETIVYDGIGNPKSYRGSELTWEKGRLLTSIEDETGEVTFGYDVFGQRNQKTAGGETTNYVYENGKLLRQITNSEVMTFIYGSEGIIGFKLGTLKYLYRKNVFGDVEEIYDESGAPVGKYSYTAFGECEIETDTNGIATKNPIRYRGYYFDEETGFYYLKTRYYDPETGRFITIDDISYLAPDTINGLNLYAYCGNNPVMYVDPSGTFNWKFWEWDWRKIGLAALGLPGLGAFRAYNSAKSLGEDGWSLFGYTLSGMFLGDYLPVLAHWDEISANIEEGYAVGEDGGYFNFDFTQNPYFSPWTAVLYAKYLYAQNKVEGRSQFGIYIELQGHYLFYLLGNSHGNPAWLGKPNWELDWTAVLSEFIADALVSMFRASMGIGTGTKKFRFKHIPSPIYSFPGNGNPVL